MLHGSRLETARLCIRPFEPADVPALVELFADPLVARYVGDGEPMDAETAALWVKRSGGNIARFGYGTGAIVDRVSGDLIGWGGFARPEDGEEEIIYGFARRVWGRGFGREVLAALVDHSVRVLRQSELWATVDPANTASIHLLETAGFVLVAEAHGGAPDCRLYRRVA